RPGLRLEHHVIRHNRGQILLTLLVDATSIAGNRLPEVLASLYEALLPFESSQACFQIHAYVPSIWTDARARSSYSRACGSHGPQALVVPDPPQASMPHAYDPSKGNANPSDTEKALASQAVLVYTDGGPASAWRQIARIADILSACTGEGHTPHGGGARRPRRRCTRGRDPVQ